MGNFIMSLDDNIRDYNLFIHKNKTDGLVNNSKELTYWGYIPINNKYLFGLYDIYKPNMKFLDLGCGVGNVLRFAKNIGYDVTGVEFDENLIQYLGDYNHIHGDITKLPLEFYKNFDVIYIYRPLKDTFDEYLNVVINNMKKESYIISPIFKIEHDNINFIGKETYQIK